MLEILEKLELLSTAAPLIAVDDGPITTVKNTQIIFDILANDTFDVGNMPVVNLTQGPNGYATLNADNSVTYTPLTDVVGIDTLGYSISDGTQTATASIFINISPTPSELYANYLTDVSLADQSYRDQVLAAAYQFRVAQANKTHVSAVSSAETAYQNAVQAADATWASADGQSQGVYDGALASIQSVYDSALAGQELAYQGALGAADAAYATAVGPYLSARDAAYDAWQGDAQNTELEAAYNQAQAALAAPTAQRDASYATALAALQAGQDAAWQVFAAAQESAWAVYQAPNQAWTAAEETAWNLYVGAKAAADNAYVSAEEAAWTVYISGVDMIGVNLASSDAVIQSQFDGQVASALSAWQTSEQTAWNLYGASMGNIPGAPVWGQRIVAPVPLAIPGVGAFPGLALQPREEFVGIRSLPQAYYNHEVQRIGAQAENRANDNFIRQNIMVTINDSGAGLGGRRQATGSTTIPDDGPLNGGISMSAFATSAGPGTASRDAFNAAIIAANTRAAVQTQRGWTGVTISTQLQLTYFVEPAAAAGQNRSGKCVVRWAIRIFINGTVGGAAVSEPHGVVRGNTWFIDDSLQTMPLYVGNVRQPGP